MSKSRIIIFFATIIGLYAYGQFNKAKEIMFKILKVKPNFTDLAYYKFEKLPLDVFVKLTNPTDIIATINTLNVKLLYNSVEIASAFKTEKFQIAAKGETTLTISCLVDIVNLSINVNDIIKKFASGSGTNLKIKGFVDTNFGRLVISENYAI